jgi:soluble lytic murein transglycosylase-like protein
MAQLADLLALARSGPTAQPEVEPVGFVPPDFRALDSLLAKGRTTSAGPPRRERPGSAPSAPGSNWERTARQMAAQRGWTGSDWRAIDSIIERESGWDPNAVNPSSGAYGIPQILPSAHPDVQLQNDPLGQIRWLLNYVQQRYGSPSAALAFKDREGWY